MHVLCGTQAALVSDEGGRELGRFQQEPFRRRAGRHGWHDRDRVRQPLARLQHAYTLAEVIVHTMVVAHRHRIAVPRFYRENAITLEAGSFKQQPDCIFHLTSGGRNFTVLFEIDNSSEPLDSGSHQSIRRKVLGYDAYQDHVLKVWKKAGRPGTRPGFRVAFLCRSVDRVHHLLLLAGQHARNRDRQLFYGATQDAYLAEPDALRNPLFLDHQGRWQALVDIHPGTPYRKSSVRLRSPVAVPLAI